MYLKFIIPYNIALCIISFFQTIIISMSNYCVNYSFRIIWITQKECSHNFKFIYYPYYQQLLQNIKNN